MSDYGDILRNERRFELAQRALPVEMLNEYGEISFATKTEAGKNFPAGDYAYVPDASKPSTWKLRLTATPGGGPDAQIVGAAIAALGKGFRGNKVSIPAEDLAKVKAKVKSAWLKANPDKTAKDLPPVVASVDTEELETETVELETIETVEGDTLVACGGGDDFSLMVNVNGISANPDPSVFAAASTLINACKAVYSGYEIDYDIDIDVDKTKDPDDSYGTELDIDVDGISQAPSDIILMAYNSFVAAVNTAYSGNIDIDVDIDVDSAEMSKDSGPSKYDEPTEVMAEPVSSPSFYDTENTQELAGLPPALKAALVKKLMAQSAKEKDPTKKAAIDAKIKLYS